MQAISYTLPQLFQDRQALESGDQQLVQRSSQSRIEAQTKTKANLSLVTAEGDTVTISVKSHFRAKLTTYDFLGQKGDSLLSLHAENFRATAKSSVDIKVKGDLNAEEWADIQTLLEKFEELAKEFFSGSIDTGFANILDTGFANILASKDLDTITSFNASLKFSQRIRIKQRAREEFGQAIPSPVSGSVSPGQRPITAESTDQFIDNLVKETQETQLLREQFRQSALADSAHSAGKKFEDILGGLAGLLKSVLDKLADQQDFGTSKRTLATIFGLSSSKSSNFLSGRKRRGNSDHNRSSQQNLSQTRMTPLQLTQRIVPYSGKASQLPCAQVLDGFPGGEIGSMGWVV